MTSQIWRSHPLEVFRQSEVRARKSNYEVSPWSQLSNPGSKDLFKHFDTSLYNGYNGWTPIPTGKSSLLGGEFEFKDIPTGYLSPTFILPGEKSREKFCSGKNLVTLPKIFSPPGSN